MQRGGQKQRQKRKGKITNIPPPKLEPKRTTTANSDATANSPHKRQKADHDKKKSTVDTPQSTKPKSPPTEINIDHHDDSMDDVSVTSETSVTIFFLFGSG
eukprot:TRINITY_DN64032_c0_g1_i1.p2 TRINITY_DN64032_c0_g1~~TRINITY_DN64032_c0_g1_i1.p2  ORF type:complete len:101 (+),score=10.62 TRINITY_DN64032_c0_g1_i1:52-354(+)